MDKLLAARKKYYGCCTGLDTRRLSSPEAENTASAILSLVTSGAVPPGPFCACPFAALPVLPSDAFAWLNTKEYSFNFWKYVKSFPTK